MILKNLSTKIIYKTILLGVLSSACVLASPRPVATVPVNIGVKVYGVNDKIISKTGDNSYEGFVVNYFDHPIEISSHSDGVGFPKKIILQPKERQVFKFNSKDENSVKLFASINGESRELALFSHMLP